MGTASSKADSTAEMGTDTSKGDSTAAAMDKAIITTITTEFRQKDQPLVDLGIGLTRFRGLGKLDPFLTKLPLPRKLAADIDRID